MTNSSVLFHYDEQFPLLMPKWGYVASAFVLFLIGFFGFFLNLMVILLMIKDRQLWTPLNMILFNLVCSDFCVSILGNPLTLISALFHQWVFGKTMCMYYGFIMSLLGIASITSLTVLSFERYMMVTGPLNSRHRSTFSSCLFIAFIWIYALLLTTPPLFGWGSYVNEAANISCSVNWHEQSTNTLTYILFLFAMGQIIPFTVITFSYCKILRTIKENSKKAGQVGRAETKVTIMVLVMIVAFAVAWTPYSIFALVEQFAYKRTISPGLGVIPALVAKSSICYDPLIYIGMNTQFRQSIRKIFSGKRKRSSSQMEKGADDSAMTLNPRMKMNSIARRYSNDSNLSNVTRKQIIMIEKKRSNSETPDTYTSVDDSNYPFIKSNIELINERMPTIHLRSIAVSADDGKEILSQLEKGSSEKSSILTINKYPERLYSRKTTAFTNRAFDLTHDDCNKKTKYNGERSKDRPVGHSYTDLNSSMTPEQSAKKLSNESTQEFTENRYRKRHSFKNKLLTFGKTSTSFDDDKFLASS